MALLAARLSRAGSKKDRQHPMMNGLDRRASLDKVSPSRRHGPAGHRRCASTFSAIHIHIGVTPAGSFGQAFHPVGGFGQGRAGAELNAVDRRLAAGEFP